MTKKSPHAPSAKPSLWYHVRRQHGGGLIRNDEGYTLGEFHGGSSSQMDNDMAERAVACHNACSPIQGDPAEALAKAREALDHFANFIGHPNPDKRERKDCELRAMAAATLAALGSPL
jgi:hypothetical protein